MSTSTQRISALALAEAEAKRQGRLKWVYCATSCVALLLLILPGAIVPQQNYKNFGTIWASGRAAANGQNPFVAYPETNRIDFSKYGGPRSAPDLNFNPPCILPALQLLSHLPIQQFLRVWLGLAWLFLCIGIVLLCVNQSSIQGRQILWLTLSIPAKSAILSGQVYTLLFLLAVLAIVLQERRYLAIGVLVATRPTMAPWLLFLFLAGHRKTALQSLSVSALLYALPIPIYGPVIYRQWFHAVGNDIHWMDPTNISVIALCTRFGIRPCGVIAALVIFAVCAIWSYRNRPDFVSVSGAGLCASILTSPIGWTGYILFPAPMFAMRRWGWVATAAAYVFFAPTEMLAGVPTVLAAVLMLSIFMMYQGADRGTQGSIIPGAAPSQA